jgi:hypothetical protein
MRDESLSAVALYGLVVIWKPLPWHAACHGMQPVLACSHFAGRWLPTRHGDLVSSVKHDVLRARVSQCDRLFAEGMDEFQ